jgi:hypothetical protein
MWLATRHLGTEAPAAQWKNIDEQASIYSAAHYSHAIIKIRLIRLIIPRSREVSCLRRQACASQDAVANGWRSNCPASPRDRPPPMPYAAVPAPPPCGYAAQYWSCPGGDATQRQFRYWRSVGPRDRHGNVDADVRQGPEYRPGRYQIVHRRSAPPTVRCRCHKLACQAEVRAWPGSETRRICPEQPTEWRELNCWTQRLRRRTGRRTDAAAAPRHGRCCRP